MKTKHLILLSRWVIEHMLIGTVSRIFNSDVEDLRYLLEEVANLEGNDLILSQITSQNIFDS